MTEASVNKRRTPPAWINQELVQTALRVGRGDPTLTVVGITTRPAIAVGDNYGSDMFRVSVELQNSSETPSLVIKVMPQTVSEEVVEKWGVFDREIKMLSQTLTKMYQVLNTKRSGQYQPFSAKCLHSGLKPHTFMVLEDLLVPGFKTAQRRAGMDLAHCSLVMRSLARFHATSVALLEQEPDHMESYKKSFYDEDGRSLFESFLTSATDSLAAEVEKWPNYVKYASKLRNISKRYFDRLVEESSIKEGRLNVLLHGDPWVNNFMFKYSGNDVVDVRFVDFQLSMISSPALDLQYFLYTSGTEEVHAHHIEALLEEYLATLNDTLALAGCSHRAISMEQLQKELDDHVFYALHAAIALLPIVLADPKDGGDIQKSMETLAEGEASAYSNAYSNELYVKRMKSLLPELEAKGCFKGF